MTTGKAGMLDKIIEQLIDNSNGAFTGCVVTNERGLIVAGMTVDGSSNQDLAAMVSLLSDTAQRVNSNLGFGHPRNASVEGLGVTVSLHEFLVQNKQFRIGAVVTAESRRRFSFFRRRKTHNEIQRSLRATATHVRHILELR